MCRPRMIRWSFWVFLILLLLLWNLQKFDTILGKWSKQNQKVSIIKVVLTILKSQTNLFGWIQLNFHLKREICHCWSFTFKFWKDNLNTYFMVIFDHRPKFYLGLNVEPEIQILNVLYYLTPFNPQRSFIICKFAKSWWRGKRGR